MKFHPRRPTRVNSRDNAKATERRNRFERKSDSDSRNNTKETKRRWQLIAIFTPFSTDLHAQVERINVLNIAGKYMAKNEIFPRIIIENVRKAVRRILMLVKGWATRKSCAMSCRKVFVLLTLEYTYVKNISLLHLAVGLLKKRSKRQKNITRFRLMAYSFVCVSFRSHLCMIKVPAHCQMHVLNQERALS